MGKPLSKEVKSHDLILFSIFINEYKIGTTFFEKADANMGVVFGGVIFVKEMEGNGYEFFKGYCESNNKPIKDDYPEDRLISTGTIDEMVIVAPDGQEVQSQGNQISGMDREGFDVYLEGISSSLFQKVFPHHLH